MFGGTQLTLSCNAALNRMDEIRTQVNGWQNMMQCTHFQSSLHTMHSVIFASHLAKLLGVNDFEQFVPLGPQPVLLDGFGLRPSPG